VLRPGEIQSVVRIRICLVMRAWIGLWIPSRSVALRLGRGGVVSSSNTTLVEYQNCCYTAGPLTGDLDVLGTQRVFNTTTAPRLPFSNKIVLNGFLKRPHFAGERSGPSLRRRPARAPSGRAALGERFAAGLQFSGSGCSDDRFNGSRADARDSSSSRFDT
jgi:hypothetical protein